MKWLNPKQKEDKQTGNIKLTHYSVNYQKNGGSSAKNVFSFPKELTVNMEEADRKEMLGMLVFANAATKEGFTCYFLAAETGHILEIWYY